MSMDPLKATLAIVLGSFAGAVLRWGCLFLTQSAGASSAAEFVVTVIGGLALGTLLGWLVRTVSADRPWRPPAMVAVIAALATFAASAVAPAAPAVPGDRLLYIGARHIMLGIFSAALALFVVRRLSAR